MKIIIAGSRTFNDYSRLTTVCDRILDGHKKIEIVSGTANGADRLGEMYAQLRGYRIKKFPAEWDTYGKSAGYRRNVQMAEYGDMLIAFWDQKSKGTKHMIDIAKKENLLIFVNIF